MICGHNADITEKRQLADAMRTLYSTNFSLPGLNVKTAEALDFSKVSAVYL